MHVLCSQMASGGLATALNPCSCIMGPLWLKSLHLALEGSGLTLIRVGVPWRALQHTFIISRSLFSGRPGRATALESASDSWGDVPPNDSFDECEQLRRHLLPLLFVHGVCLRMLAFVQARGRGRNVACFAVVEKPF